MPSSRGHTALLHFLFGLNPAAGENAVGGSGPACLLGSKQMLEPLPAPGCWVVFPRPPEPCPQFPGSHPTVAGPSALCKPTSRQGPPNSVLHVSPTPRTALLFPLMRPGAHTPGQLGWDDDGIQTCQLSADARSDVQTAAFLWVSASPRSPCRLS